MDTRWPPLCDTAALKTRLYDEFRARAPIVTWQGQPFVRVSIHAHNTRVDLEGLMYGLARILDR